MIDSGTTEGPDWLPQLRGLVRGSAHETRNALNGLVVNLEVVRSRLARNGGEESLLAFAEQASAQAEESVRLSEAAASLLQMVAGSIGENGELRCARTMGSEPALHFELDASTAERVLPGLRTLGKALGFDARTRDGAVILSFPQTSGEFKQTE